MPEGSRLDGTIAFLAQLFGGGAMLLFVVGPHGYLDLGLGDPGVLAWDAALCLAFFLQHSIMVRRSVKARLARRVPARWIGALYSIVSGVVLAAVMLLWQRTGARIVSIEGPLRWLGWLGVALALAGIGWGVASLRHFDTFGVGPIRRHRLGRPERPPVLTVRGAYRWVRHPMYLCMLVLIWSSLDLTVDRLLFDVLWTAWIAVGTVLEERDLVADMGPAYAAYQRRVPMLLPWRRPIPESAGTVMG